MNDGELITALAQDFADLSLDLSKDDRNLWLPLRKQQGDFPVTCCPGGCSCHTNKLFAHLAPSKDRVPKYCLSTLFILCDDAIHLTI